MFNENFILKNGGYSNYEGTTAMPRHRWYYYKEGFSPGLVQKAIEEVGVEKDELIIDPFNGSGTTTLTASLDGYNALGIEVNPFTAFLSDTKNRSISPKNLSAFRPDLLSSSESGAVSDLIGFSTFSKTEKLDRWLFNDSVLSAFEGGWKFAEQLESHSLKKLFKLALISSAMQNCNATRDGKCLRYRENWTKNNYDDQSFLASLTDKLQQIESDISSHPITNRSTIIQGDCRRILKSKKVPDKFRLCITSPPYLNTFDYTDIYRPELFLGKFVTTRQGLYDLRLKTIRSHVQAIWRKPKQSDFGLMYQQSMKHLNENLENLGHKNIPLMVQAYFEDMSNILKVLREKAHQSAELWLVVSNSAYADREIPVDLIIGDIGSKSGWYLKEIGVMRHLKKRMTKFSPNITLLRESVVIFTSNKQ